MAVTNQQLSDNVIESTSAYLAPTPFRPTQPLVPIQQGTSTLIRVGQQTVTTPTVTPIVGVNPSGSFGIPDSLLSASATSTPILLNGQIVDEVVVTFTRDGSDPNFGYVRVWFTGYQGSSTPVLMASGATSPITFTAIPTGETVVVTVQPVSPSGLTAPLSYALSGTVTLSGVASAPPAPTISQSLINTPTGYQFAFTFITGLLTDVIANYRVYRSIVNSTSGATMVRAIPQDANSSSAYVFQDDIGSQSGVTQYYWVSSVNTSGLESSKTPAQSGAVANGGWVIPPQYNTTVVIANANFEASTVLTNSAPPGWVAQLATLSYETSSQYAGTQSLQVAASVTNGGANTAQQWSCKPGDQFYISAAQKSDGTSNPATLVLFFDTSGNFLSSSGATHGTGTSWSIDTGTATAPAGAVTFYVRCANSLTGGGGTCYFDQVLVDRMVNPATTMTAQGSTPYSISGAFTYTSTTTTVTVSWSGIVIYRADGTTTLITNGSQLITGLSSSTTYYVYPYYDDKVGGTAPSFINGSSPAVGSPEICWPAVSILLAQAQNLQYRIPLNNGGMAVVTPSSGSGGGTGGGGGGGGCFTGNVSFQTPNGLLKFSDIFRFSDAPTIFKVKNETGVHEAELLVHEHCSGELIDMGDGEFVTLNHLMKSGDSWVRAEHHFPEKRRVHFEDVTVYNMHVLSDNANDKHYVLGNGEVAHNYKPL